MGCAILAGVANGIWTSVEIDEIYYPNPENKEIYEKTYNKYVEISNALNPTFY